MGRSLLRALAGPGVVLMGCPSTPPSKGPDGGTGACESPAVVCGDQCADTQTDAAHCGGCNVACTPTESCAGGRCYPRACAGVTCAAIGDFNRDSKLDVAALVTANPGRLWVFLNTTP